MSKFNTILIDEHNKPIKMLVGYHEIGCPITSDVIILSSKDEIEKHIHNKFGNFSWDKNIDLTYIRDSFVCVARIIKDDKKINIVAELYQSEKQSIWYKENRAWRDKHEYKYFKRITDWDFDNNKPTYEEEVTILDVPDNKTDNPLELKKGEYLILGYGKPELVGGYVFGRFGARKEKNKGYVITDLYTGFCIQSRFINKIKTQKHLKKVLEVLMEVFEHENMGTGCYDTFESISQYGKNVIKFIDNLILESEWS